jgi:hypothetical protein
MASSSDIGGKMVGIRLASIVFPAPGGPMNKMLCPPAQATSKARCAACCYHIEILHPTRPNIHFHLHQVGIDAVHGRADCFEQHAWRGSGPS